MGKNIISKNILSMLSGKKVMGLYVGSHTVDLVILKGTLKGPKLVKFVQTPIYPKQNENEEVAPESSDETSLDQAMPQNKSENKTKDDYIVEAIQRVFEENNIKPVNIVSAISSEETMVRYFQMPKIPKQEWSAAVNFEAKRYIPFRMADVASDFQVIKSKVSPGNMDVVFTAVKQTAIRRFIALLEKAGIRPMIIEPAPFSLIRAFNVAGQIDDNINTAIVNIDEKTANINILKNGIPYIIRDIPLEGDTLGGKSFDPIFEKLLAEIKLSFDFYEKQFPSEVIDKIIIYSHVPLENWYELVGKELQIPVETGDPFRGIRIKKGVVPPKLAISFGLALRGISESFIDVNLYKEKFLLHRHKELFLRAVFLEASAAVFILIILRVLCMKTLVPLSSELDRAFSERPKVEVDIRGDDIAELERKKNEMLSEKNFMKDSISNRTYFTNRLAGLATVVPGNIWLTEISFEEKEDKKDSFRVLRYLNIKGYCFLGGRNDEAEIVNNFLMDLKENYDVNRGMSRADIVSVERGEIENEKVASFEILFTGP